MYIKIDITHCRKGDVIVTSGGGAASGVIRNGVGSSVSHAMLYLGDRFVLEAIAQGVKKRTWQEAITKDGEVTLAIALRHKSIASEAARQAVVDAAMKFENRLYDTVGAIGSGTFGDRRGGIIGGAGCVVAPMVCAPSLAAIRENAKDENADKFFFCSEVVARAFSEAKYQIVDGKATWQTPGAIRLSPYLNYVGHLIDTVQPKYKPPRSAGYRKD